MMVQALSVIQYVMIFNLFGISLRLVATSETQEKTHERQLVDNANVLEKIDRDKVGIRGYQLVHGGRLQQMGISRALHKKATHDDKMGTNSKLWQKKLIRTISNLRRTKMILGDLLKGKKETQGKKMVSISKLLRNNLPYGALLKDKNVRRRHRRGMGYRMHCVPSTKKVCKKIKYKGEETQWCTMVAYQKCYAID